MKRSALLFIFLPSLAFAQTAQPVNLSLTGQQAQVVGEALNIAIKQVGYPGSKALGQMMDMLVAAESSAIEAAKKPASATPAPIAAQASAPATNDAVNKDK